MTNAFASKLGGMLSQVPAMGVIMQLTSMAMVVDSVTNIMDSLNDTFNKTTDDKYVEKKQSRTNEATTNSNLGSQLNLIPEPLKLSDDSGKAELSSAVSEKKSSSSSSSSGAQASSVGAFSGTVKKDKNKDESYNKIGKNDYKNAVAMR